MDDLIKRLQEAPEGSRELSEAIQNRIRETTIIKPGERPLTSDHEYTPPYTESLDAALTLVPTRRGRKSGRYAVRRCVRLAEQENH